jgi:hypothetical protein
LAFTGRSRPAGADASRDWLAMGGAAGFEVEDVVVLRDSHENWTRLYEQWVAHEAELRAELGDRAAGNLIREATLSLHREESLPAAMLFVLRAPA